MPSTASGGDSPSSRTSHLLTKQGLLKSLGSVLQIFPEASEVAKSSNPMAPDQTKDSTHASSLTPLAEYSDEEEESVACVVTPAQAKSYLSKLNDSYLVSTSFYLVLTDGGDVVIKRNNCATDNEGSYEAFESEFKNLGDYMHKNGNEKGYIKLLDLILNFLSKHPKNMISIDDSIKTVFQSVSQVLRDRRNSLTGQDKLHCDNLLPVLDMLSGGVSLPGPAPGSSLSH